MDSFFPLVHQQVEPLEHPAADRCSVLFTHLVQAHECVESFSCSHRHLCVVFLQDQHVKHQLEVQTMRHTE